MAKLKKKNFFIWKEKRISFLFIWFFVVVECIMGNAKTRWHFISDYAVNSFGKSFFIFKLKKKKSNTIRTHILRLLSLLLSVSVSAHFHMNDSKEFQNNHFKWNLMYNNFDECFLFSSSFLSAFRLISSSATFWFFDYLFITT